MDLEKLATSAIVTALSKTERLSSFINDGDKEPCWDGNIYIHEDKAHSKKNIKKVATQVKGKAVNKKSVKDIIKYPITYHDLDAYMNNGGTFFFVVYLDKETGEVLQIYYANLLPFRIKRMLKTKKTKYSVALHKFPEDEFEKTELLMNFHINAQKQVSFVTKDTPTIEELERQGVLESLTFSYTGLGKDVSVLDLPKKLDGKSVTIYANIKGASVSIPVEHYESIQHITMQSKKEIPVSVNGEVFYDSFKTITTSNNLEFHIGSCFKLIVPQKHEEKMVLDIKIKVNGCLSERIKGMEFVKAVIANGSFCIGKQEFNMNITEQEREMVENDKFISNLRGYKKAKRLLDRMHVTKDLDIQNCSEEELGKLNFLIAAIEDNLLARELPVDKEPLQKIKIANLTLAVVYLENENGGYKLCDYFGNHFLFQAKLDDGDLIRLSQFSKMTSEDFLQLDNLYLPIIVDDFKLIELSDTLCETANMLLLEMIKAYDMCSKQELLDIAKQLSEWLLSCSDYFSKGIATINNLQLVLRERALTFNEKQELYQIISNTEDSSLKLGGFLLLGEKAEVENIMSVIDDEELQRFKEYPIYKFYNQ